MHCSGIWLDKYSNKPPPPKKKKKKKKIANL